MTKKELNWKSVTPAKLPQAVKKEYAAKQATDKASKSQRLKFEESFINAARKTGKIEDTQTLRFSYRWGNLAVAVDDLAAGEQLDGDDDSRFEL